MEQRRKAEVL